MTMKLLCCCCCCCQLKHHNAAIQEKELALKLAAQRQEFLQHLSKMNDEYVYDEILIVVG